MVSSQDGSDMIYNYRFTYFGPLQMAKSENKQHKSRCLIAVHVPFLQCDVSSIWRDFPVNALPLTFYHLYFVTFTESSRSSVDVLSGIFCIWYHFPRELLFSLPISQPESSIVRGGGVGVKGCMEKKCSKIHILIESDIVTITTKVTPSEWNFMNSHIFFSLSFFSIGLY